MSVRWLPKQLYYPKAVHFCISKTPKMSIYVNGGPEFCPRDPSQTVGVRRRDSRNPGNATRDPPNAIPDSTNMPLVPQTHPRDRNTILYRENRPNSAPIACAHPPPRHPLPRPHGYRVPWRAA